MDVVLDMGILRVYQSRLDEKRKVKEIKYESSSCKQNGLGVEDVGVVIAGTIDNRNGMHCGNDVATKRKSRNG